jgi:hypothetical protein
MELGRPASDIPDTSRGAQAAAPGRPAPGYAQQEVTAMPADTTETTEVIDSDSLDRAVEAAATALTALRAEPRAYAVAAAVDRASQAVDALGPGVTAVVLRRLLASIADCHRDGLRDSSRLAVCRRTITVALRLDPRWTSARSRTGNPRPGLSHPARP